MATKFELIEQAKKYLRGEELLANEDCNALHRGLISYDLFSYASEILLKKIEEDKQEGHHPPLKSYLDLVLNIYKDTSLSSYFKFDKAIKTLEAEADLSNSSDVRTLGLAGAVYKRRWQFDSQYGSLILSKSYYKKAYELWIANKNQQSNNTNYNCYAGINYALVNELQAIESIELYASKTGITKHTLDNYELAKKVRENILKVYFEDITALEPKEKKSINSRWIYATYAEAFFGLRLYKQAAFFSKKYFEASSDLWETRSFRQQMLLIAHLQLYVKNYIKDSSEDIFEASKINLEEINNCLKVLDLNTQTNEDLNYMDIYKNGKLGLALSGGGFRASLFHIGVLAGLAEKDELKDIEIISCVSGGSIIGAYYYLKLKELLENKDDNEIEKGDYVAIVKDIEKNFLKAVQKNIRVQLFTNLGSNFKMFINDDYSRSHRLGELYEKYFYAPIFKNSNYPGFKEIYEKNSNTIYMDDLFINPLNATDFDIKNENWKRKNKIPQLILNATTVNTGHNWQFTASWMGEPPTYISDEFDVKPRLRRMYYKDAPNSYKKFKLGYAVAASSCVPVLFEPLILKGLFKGIDLELIDGGLHDNQGISSIIEQECKSIIISDASGQLPEDFKKTQNELSLFLRTDNILQERVRELQFLDIKSKKYSSNLNQLTTVHLKKDLTTLPINWIDCTDVNRRILHHADLEDENILLDYGIMKKIQKLLSEVRTDLDSFNNLEAYALMYSGYKQTIHESSNKSATTKEAWNFLEIAGSCTQPEQEKQLIKQLKVSKAVPFKMIKLSTPFAVLFFSIVSLFIITCLYQLWQNWNNPQSILNKVVAYKSFITLFVLIVLGYVFKFIAILTDIKGWIKKKAILIALLIVGFVIANIYIYLVNPWYNKLGELKK